MIVRLFRQFSKNTKRPSFIPDNMTNFNFEENRTHIKDLEKALKQQNELEDSVDKPKAKKKVSQIKKDVNSDITDFHLWRELDYNKNVMYETDAKSKVDGKLKARPIDLWNAFGMPHFAHSELYKASSVFVFQDNFLDTYYLYDHQKEGVQGDPYEFYFNFWQSEIEHEFRITHTEYANRYKFKRMVYKIMEEVKQNPEEGFEKKAEKLVGNIELYDNYNTNYEIRTDPAIFKHKRADFGKSKINFEEEIDFDQFIPPSVDIREEPDVQRVE